MPHPAVFPSWPRYQNLNAKPRSFFSTSESPFRLTLASSPLSFKLQIVFVLVSRHASQDLPLSVYDRYDQGHIYLLSKSLFSFPLICFTNPPLARLGTRLNGMNKSHHDHTRDGGSKVQVQSSLCQRVVSALTRTRPFFELKTPIPFLASPAGTGAATVRYTPTTTSSRAHNDKVIYLYCSRYRARRANSGCGSSPA